MGNPRYEKYLLSDAWKAKRREVMARAGGECEKKRCKRNATQVHHKTYRNLGNEPLGDLEALCFPCHAKEHPDKKMSSGGGTFPAHGVECHVCGHDVALLTLAGPKKKFRCYKCGGYWVEYREGSKQKRKQDRSKKKRKRRTQVQCGHCGAWKLDRIGIEQHTRDKHPGEDVRYVLPDQHDAPPQESIEKPLPKPKPPEKTFSALKEQKERRKAEKRKRRARLTK